LVDLARKRQRFGYRRLTALLQREGFTVNHKKVYRIYREQGLAMRRRKRRYIVGGTQPVSAEAALNHVNQRWAMDFVNDTLANGRTFRALTIVDEYTRECPAIEADTSLPGARVIRVKATLEHTGVAGGNTSGQRSGVHQPCGAQLVRRQTRFASLHTTRPAHAEWTRRIVQRPVPGRMPERELVHQP
jgi:hypothetical protein